MWNMHEGAGWWMLFGWLWFAIFIVGLVWIIKKLTDRGSSEGRGSALDIARQRYARGEISKEEFEQLKKDLS